MRGRVHDREILRLAIPALGALAAEPLYLLADTAIVGHLGTPQLAALALAGALLSGLVGLCNFLTYATTARVARLHGAGQEAQAGEIAAQALWLSLCIGVVLTGVCAVAAGPLMGFVGGHGHVATLAARYLRISAIGVPAALIALSGQGYLRGVSRLRAPLVVVVVANLANVALELVLVYGAHLGLDGSALGTVIAQAGMGIAFAALLLAAPARRRRPQRAGMRSLMGIGGAIFLRTGALYGAFLMASAVVARIGSASLGAHQIAFELFTFLALVLDAIAIAGQVIVGRALGAGDGALAREASQRMLVLALALGCALGLALLALRGPLPHLFTDDPRVLHRAHQLWPLFALMQPIGAVVFALDGILIGAGDGRFLAGAMLGAFVVFVPIGLLALHEGWGIVGVWAGLDVMMVVRCATLGARFLGERWVVLGAS
jgi:putative MATE family efflux protein